MRRRDIYLPWQGPVTALVGLLVFAVAGCGNGAPLPTAPDDQPATGQGPSHDPTLLATHGGSESNAWAINDLGVVAGWSGISGGRAIRWTDDGAVDLIGSWSGARAINNQGTIAGYYGPGASYQAYVLHDGVVTDLEALEPLEPDAWTFAHGINQAGTVVGVSSGRVAVWSASVGGGYEPPIHLHLFLSGSNRVAINARGDVTFTSFGNGWPVLWIVQPDGGYGEPLWLGRTGHTEYSVRGINDAGVIVGAGSTAGVSTALAWLPGRYDQPVSLGVGEAWDVNLHGQIVGTTGGDLPNFGGVARRPALWTVGVDGTITGPSDLGTPSGYASGGARAINDKGFVVGSSWGPGPVRATLWTPRH